MITGLLLQTIIIFLFHLNLIKGTSDKVDWTWSKQEDWKGSCNTGKKQSPLDFPDNFNYDQSAYMTINSASFSKISYKLSVYQNYLFQAELKNSGSITVVKNGVKYKYVAENMSFHIDSEHSFNGKKSDIEIQFIHKKDVDFLTTQGVSEDPDKLNQYLIFALRYNIDKVAKPNADLENFNFGTVGPTSASIDLSKFIPIGKPFYHYEGSSTSPDCLENVNWVVPQEVGTISQTQYDALNKWISGVIQEKNVRAAKPLNGRKLYYQLNNIKEEVVVDEIVVSYYKSKLTKEEKEEYDVSI